MTQILTPELIKQQADATGEQQGSRQLRRPAAQQFARRGQRLRQLAAGHSLGDYLQFCATIADAQQQLLEDSSPLHKSLSTLLASLLKQCDEQLNHASRDAVHYLLQLDEFSLQTLAGELTAGQTPDNAALLPGLPLLGAAIQLKKLAASQQQLAEHGDSQSQHCPCCGGPAVATVLRQNEQGHAVRFACCALCASEWPLSRLFCLNCGNSKNLQYRSLANLGAALPSKGDSEAVRHRYELECCDECHGALKQFSALEDAAIEPLADDLASLSLDILAAEQGYGRIGFNPLLLHPAQ